MQELDLYEIREIKTKFNSIKSSMCGEYVHCESFVHYFLCLLFQFYLFHMHISSKKNCFFLFSNKFSLNFSIYLYSDSQYFFNSFFSIYILYIKNTSIILSTSLFVSFFLNITFYIKILVFFLEKGNNFNVTKTVN